MDQGDLYAVLYFVMVLYHVLCFVPLFGRAGPRVATVRSGV